MQDVAAHVFEAEFNAMAEACHQTSRDKGWWEADRNVGEMIALMHSELSEMLEAFRDGDPPSEKCPGFTHAEEEAADVVIRLMDMASRRGWNLGGAIVAKAEFNKSRPHKHGGRQF